MQQRRSLVPGRVLRPSDDVVAVQRRDGHEGKIRSAQLRREGTELRADRLEHVFRPVDQVHLVDDQQQVRYAQQRDEEGMPAALLEDPLAGVDEHEGQVCRRRPGDHVARVLDVSGRVRDDELPARGGEVTVRDIDGDALLALRAQAVREQRKVGVLVAAVTTRALYALELVLEDRLGVVEQAADQRAFPIVDRARSRQTQDVHG